MINRSFQSLFVFVLWESRRDSLQKFHYQPCMGGLLRDGLLSFLVRCFRPPAATACPSPPLKYLSVLECLQLRWGNKFSLLIEPWIRKTGPSKNIFYNANFTNLIDTHSHRLTMTGKTSRCGICGLYFESRTLLKRHIDQVHRITNESIRVLND